MTGCKNNRYELEKILEWAIRNDVAVTREDEADFCVINTCTVTHVADKKSRQMIRKAKNQNSKSKTQSPKLKTVVFGCAARMQKNEFKKIGEIDHLFDNLDEVIGFLNSQMPACTYKTPPALRAPSPERKGGLSCAAPDKPFAHSRALVQIQDGCDNFCAYCIIASARGRSKSRPKADILDEINRHVENGYNEVILTGINIGAYGASRTTKPEESRFAELLEEIIHKTKVPLIRLTSLGPEYFSEKLFKVLKNPRICRHIHLSIQSASDSVLKRMRRNYDVKKLEEIIKNLKKNIPGIAITSDIIVGFPEETEKEFKETYDFVKKNKLAKCHIFPYSIRANTIAAKMKQVPDNVKKERALKLQKLADKQRKEFLKDQTGKKAMVIWSYRSSADGLREGITDNYIDVRKKGRYTPKSITEEVLEEKMIV
jgi:threonylcarbamoyladenosine tRNA methylthiotransferase MtaB